MVLAKRKEVFKQQTRTVNIEGEIIPVTQPSFELSTANWEKFCGIIRDLYNTDKARSQAIRILINGVNLELIDLEKLTKEIEKAAEKTKDTIYI